MLGSFIFVETTLFSRIVEDYLTDSSERTKSMATPRRDIGEEILAGIRELKRGETSRIRHMPPIALTRERVGLSQGQFAKLLGVSVRTLQEWEQGRRAPSGAARTLILVASRHPEALLDVARSGGRAGASSSRDPALRHRSHGGRRTPARSASRAVRQLKPQGRTAAEHAAFPDEALTFRARIRQNDNSSALENRERDEQRESGEAGVSRAPLRRHGCRRRRGIRPAEA